MLTTIIEKTKAEIINQYIRIKTISRIKRAKTKGVKLYFCGVYHDIRGGEAAIPLSEVVRQIRPDKVLLELRTPESIYYRKKATGKFATDITSPNRYFSSPDITEIKEEAESLECLVQGMDLSSSEKDKLVKECNLYNVRLKKIYDSLREKCSELLYGEEQSLTNAQISKIKKFSISLRNTQVLRASDPNYSDATSFLADYKAITLVVNSFPKIREFFEDILEYLSEAGDDLKKYHGGRDTPIFRNIMSHYDNEAVILVLAGSGHTEESAPLIKSVKEADIPYISFLNYSSILKGRIPLHP